MTGPMRVRPLPSVNELRMLIRFDGDNFYWNPRPVSDYPLFSTWASWTARCANKKVAIKTMSNGYLGVRVNGTLILCHRLIWALHYGEWPKGELDHIDRNKTNNEIANLRDCTKSENMKNQKLRSDSTSGFPGVHWSKEKRKWYARVGRGGKWHHVGIFDDKDEAIAARKAAQEKMGFSNTHGEAA